MLALTAAFSLVVILAPVTTLAAPVKPTEGGGSSTGSSSGPGTACSGGKTVCVQQPSTSYQCGSGTKAVKTSINFGCYGDKCQTNCSALVDALFAIIRFLSATVGIVLIASTIWAGIQYGAARDDPSAVGKAKSRLASNGTALLLFIFGYAILNYVIPAGFFLK